MISVCMATKNGAKYIREQLDSILVQLREDDEVIISDDASDDNTLDIIRSYNEPRIHILENKVPVGITRNFEKSLMQSRGNFIFLADQDDVWANNKIEVTLNHLQVSALVVTDCLIVDHSLRLKDESFFKVNNSGKGLIRNLLKNSYIGCCMAFRRELLDYALPFPKDIPIHDVWIGVLAEVHFDVKFIPEQLVYHRRHAANASSTGQKSELNIITRLNHRYRIIKNLILRKSYAG